MQVANHFVTDDVMPINCMTTNHYQFYSIPKPKMTHDSLLLDSVEELYGKVERELVEEDSRQKPRRVNAAQIKNVQCGEELYTIFSDNFDSSLYR